MSHPLMTAADARALAPEVHELLMTANALIKSAAEQDERRVFLPIATIEYPDLRGSPLAMADAKRLVDRVAFELRERGYSVALNERSERMGSHISLMVTW